jgi:hypothetical protein
MKNIYILATIVSVVYVMFNLIDNKFVTKKKIVLKTLTKNAIFVFLSFVVSYYIYKQIEPTKASSSPDVFITDPAF